jgi:hypothetical protein
LEVERKGYAGPEVVLTEREKGVEAPLDSVDEDVDDADSWATT